VTSPQAVSDQLGQDVFGEFTLPEQAGSFTMPGVIPSSETQTAEQRPGQEKPPVVEPTPAPEPPSTPEPGVFAGGQQSKDVEAAKRGDLGPAEQVKAVVAQGTSEEQKQELGKLMAEFTENAPEYEGPSKGLAIAKMGFAMAAGQSPNAITNIANAMSDGADALIKDKRERDAFDRQVKLSALQYGIGEISKQRAQQRLDERTLNEFVDAKTGKPVLVSNAEYFANGNKLPEGLMNKELYTDIQTAINERQQATNDLIKEAQERRFMTVDDQTGYREDYSSLVKKASAAETAGAFLEKTISSAAEDQITGPYAAAKSAAAKAGAVFGVDLPDSFTTRDRAVQDLKAALQPMVDVTLGENQSANSISDRDVNLLIQGFLADGIMNENADGVLNFVAVPQEVFVNSLQNGLRQIRKSQADTLNEMSAIESELAELYTPGGRVGTAVIKPFQARRSSAAPQPSANTLSFDADTGQYFVPGIQ